MLKQTAQNTFFSAAAQGASLVATLFLAAQMTAAAFGMLILQLSYAALISTLLTLQFERVYVRQSIVRLPFYLAFHLQLVTALHALAFLPALLFPYGVSSVLLAFGMALTQMANYSLARQGRFRRIWILKSIQGSSLLLGTLLLWRLGHLDHVWLVFLLSNVFAGAMIVDAHLLSALRGPSLRNGFRRIRYSFPVAWKSLSSLSVGTAIRELPVYVAGAIGQPQLAASLGLVARVIGIPIGLIARSAAAVVSNYVARGKFDRSTMIQLGVVPAGGIVLALAAYLVLPNLEAFASYDQLGLFILVMSPYYLAKAYSGLLGPAIVYFRKQGLELQINIVALCVTVASTVLVLTGHTTFITLPGTISISAVVLTPFLLAALARAMTQQGTLN